MTAIDQLLQGAGYSMIIQLETLGTAFLQRFFGEKEVPLLSRCFKKVSEACLAALDISTYNRAEQFA